MIAALQREPGVHMVWRQSSGMFKNPNGGYYRFGTPNMADVGGVLDNGQYFAVECKSKNDSPTDGQGKWLAWLSKAGCRCGVAYTVKEALAIVRGNN